MKIPNFIKFIIWLILLNVAFYLFNQPSDWAVLSAILIFTFLIYKTTKQFKL